MAAEARYWILIQKKAALAIEFRGDTAPIVSLHTYVQCSGWVYGCTREEKTRETKVVEIESELWKILQIFPLSSVHLN